MPKYLMIDHGSLLSGEYISNLSDITPNDLILSTLKEGGLRVIKNGVETIHHLNTLIKDYGYQFLYHSSNPLCDQLKLDHDLARACAAKGITFPNVSAIAVFNKTCKAPDSAPKVSFPCLMTGPRSFNVKIVEFCTDDLGKRSLRTALGKALKISYSDIAQSHVFDDSPGVIRMVPSEGYTAHEIHIDYTLTDALQKVLEVENRMEKIAERKSAPAEKSPSKKVISL